MGLFDLLLNYNNATALQVVDRLVRYRSNLSVVWTGTMLRPLCDNVPGCVLPSDLAVSVWGQGGDNNDYLNQMVMVFVNYGNKTISMSSLSPPSSYQISLAAYISSIPGYLGVNPYGSDSVFKVSRVTSTGGRVTLTKVQNFFNLNTLPDIVPMDPLIIAVKCETSSIRSKKEENILKNLEN